MRYLVTATMAASVLAIGLRMEPAQSLPLGEKIGSPETAVRQVQQKGDGQSRLEKGTRKDEPRRGERSRRFDGDRDRDRGRDGFYFKFAPGGPSFGYGPARGCDWLRRRAIETDSPYWWRRYRACRG